MSAILKEGTRIRIKKDLLAGPGSDDIYGIFVSNTMVEHAGKVVTILKVCPKRVRKNHEYHIYEDSDLRPNLCECRYRGWSWTEKMFDIITPEYSFSKLSFRTKLDYAVSMGKKL